MIFSFADPILPDQLKLRQYPDFPDIPANNNYQVSGSRLKKRHK